VLKEVKFLKKLWNQNRVLFMLILILLICFIAIVTVAVTFFYSKEVDSYGKRLENIEKYPITNDFKDDYKASLLESETVSKVSFKLIGRILYVHIDFNEDAKLEDAKKIVTSSLELFDEDILGYYDIEFILESENFTTFGAKNSIIDFISWTNQRVVEEESNEE